ncbi:hypothetical protein RRG08_015600 [Elysia crispata]|uniref:Uncharacterized protein n=1 Tax=Elysia crispata TaxID=231223 RepID=A0AAE0YHA2_9GAST|nr:hypothetical protein RRG08_015600 [Elysia crispata]
MFAKASLRTLDWVYGAKTQPTVLVELKGECTAFCNPETFQTLEKLQKISAPGVQGSRPQTCEEGWGVGDLLA